MDLLHPFFCPFTMNDPDGKLSPMRKQLSIFILVFASSFAFAKSPATTAKKSKASPPAASQPAKNLSLQTGSQWVLAKDLTLQKTGLTPEEFVPYTSIWDLKTQSFVRSSSSSSDSCEFRTTVSKKIMKVPLLKVKKSAAFKITNIQETTMSILVDIVSRDAKKSGIDQIQITCSAYEQGLDSPELKEKFKSNLSASLAAIFISKN